MSYHQHLNCYKIRAKKFVRVLDKGRTLFLEYGSNPYFANLVRIINNFHTDQIQIFRNMTVFIKTSLHFHEIRDKAVPVTVVRLYPVFRESAFRLI